VPYGKGAISKCHDSISAELDWRRQKQGSPRDGCRGKQDSLQPAKTFSVDPLHGRRGRCGMYNSRGERLKLSMLRRVVVFIGCVSALIVSLQAPYLHTHEYSNPFDHGGPFHSHFKHLHSHSPADGPGLRASDPDDDAEFLTDAVPLAKASSLKLLFLCGTSLPIIAPTRVPIAASAVTPRTHDPPGLHGVSPRAPPV
jgi:hypothetical protein